MRILSETDALDAWADHLHLTIQAVAPDLLADLPMKPRMDSIVEERLRQKLTNGKTLKKRQYMRQVRTASSDLGNTATGMKMAAQHELRVHGLTPQRKAEIDKMLEEELQLPIGTDLESIPPPVTTTLAIEHALQQEIGLGEGVEIEPDPETQNLEQDLAEGKLF